MKIAIVADKFIVERGTGISRYINELSKRLGITCNVELIGTSPSGTLKSISDHIALVPLEVLKNRNNFDLFHAATPVNALCFPLLQKPTVITYHDLATILYNRGSKYYVKFSAPYFYNIGRYCDKVIAVSSQTKEELVKYLKFPEQKIELINLGVDERFHPLKKPEKNHFVIGYLGTLAARKRVDYLIRAFYYLKKINPEIDVKLKIYGKIGQEYANLVKLVEDLKLTKDIEFKGSVSDDKLINIYNSFDVFVVPSEWEGFGLHILESQRCGVPVVTRGDAHIPFEVSRYCIKVNSENDMAHNVYRLLVNYNFRSKIIDNGLEYSKQFTWEKTVKETIRVYEEVLSI